MNTISGHCLCRMIAFSYEGAPNWTLRYETTRRNAQPIRRGPRK